MIAWISDVFWTALLFAHRQKSHGACIYGQGAELRSGSTQVATVKIVKTSMSVNCRHVNCRHGMSVNCRSWCGGYGVVGFLCSLFLKV